MKFVPSLSNKESLAELLSKHLLQKKCTKRHKYVRRMRLMDRPLEAVRRLWLFHIGRLSRGCLSTNLAATSSRETRSKFSEFLVRTQCICPNQVSGPSYRDAAVHGSKLGRGRAAAETLGQFGEDTSPSMKGRYRILNGEKNLCRP
jgi:hypothetical protein